MNFVGYPQANVILSCPVSSRTVRPSRDGHHGAVTFAIMAAKNKAKHGAEPRNDNCALVEMGQMGESTRRLAHESLKLT